MPNLSKDEVTTVRKNLEGQSINVDDNFVSIISVNCMTSIYLGTVIPTEVNISVRKIFPEEEAVCCIPLLKLKFYKCKRAMLYKEIVPKWWHTNISYILSVKFLSLFSIL